MPTIGVIGCGHWGPNHIRIFHQLPKSRVGMCADPDPQRRTAVAKLYPGVAVTEDYREVLRAAEIDAVCVASPTDTHYTVTREALEHGKHVLCEKPLSLRAEECLALEELARERGRVLMVGHVFLFNRGIVRLKDYVRGGELGRIQYAHSERTNLGPFRYDVNALWDLAPHDISIFNHLFEACPLNVSARGQTCLGTAQEDLAFASLEYPDGVLVNIHVSWLDPKKVRQITIVGDRKMATWDDLDACGPIRLYDKHVERTSMFYETYGEFQLLSREGSITIPHIGFHEPLKVQDQHFLDVIAGEADAAISDARRAYDVVRTLEAVQRSMDGRGRPEEVMA